jgi:hypothetical protein
MIVLAAFTVVPGEPERSGGEGRGPMRRAGLDPLPGPSGAAGDDSGACP